MLSPSLTLFAPVRQVVSPCSTYGERPVCVEVFGDDPGSVVDEFLVCKDCSVESKPGSEAESISKSGIGGKIESLFVDKPIIC